MTFLNEGRWDRAMRMLTGIFLLGTAWAVSLNAFSIALFAIGAIAIATGIAGWCPAYTLLGISTVRAPRGHCVNCEAVQHD